MRSAWRIVLIAACASLAAGCASTLSGLGGTPSYACKAPEGVLCTSVAGVYANSLQNNLPSQRTEKRAADPVGNVVTSTRAAPAANPTPDAASMRSAPRVLRLWVAPWEDSDGDLQDQSYLYVVVDSGRWLIEHQRASIRNAYTPIAAPNPAPLDTIEPNEPTPSATVSLPRPGVPSFPANATALPPKVDNDAEPTLR